VVRHFHPAAVTSAGAVFLQGANPFVSANRLLKKMGAAPIASALRLRPSYPVRWHEEYRNPLTWGPCERVPVPDRRRSVPIGGLGLLIMGVLDSSILFVPMGNDLLLVAMTASQKERLPFYVILATLGSVIGTWMLDSLVRKGAEAGVRRFGSEGRLETVKAKMAMRAGWILATTALILPPFPYKIFVAAAAALQYPRKKLLLITAGARFARFVIEGLAAVYFGAGILRLAESPAVRYGVALLLLLSTAGRALSIYRWVK
jgi:membrane protein YqaA with SNARE-associated domain